MRAVAVAAVTVAGVLLLVSPAAAHRVDEYLQAGTVLLSTGHFRLDLRLAPGLVVASTVLDSIDFDRDGRVSTDEERTYAQRILRDLRVTLDGHPLSLSLDSSRFDAVPMLRRGMGEMQLTFDAAVPATTGSHRLTIENRHRAPISAYLMNSLVPDDPGVHIEAQERDVSQSMYTVLYRTTASAPPLSSADASGLWLLLAAGGVAGTASSIRQRWSRRRNRAD